MNTESGLPPIEAMLYRQEGEMLVCELCAHYCKLKDGRLGICGVRKRIGNKLYTLVYGKAIASAIDPIEKKPFFHVLPGTRSFSIATIGCNFRCAFCQNWDISQKRGVEAFGRDLPPKEVVRLAKQSGCQTVAYTYSEPTIFFEYTFDTARLADEEGILSLYVTNGYMTQKMLQTFAPYLAAANVDLKGFDDKRYRRIMGAKLEPVLESIKEMKALGIFLEVTTLVVPGLNDSELELGEIAEFLASIDPQIPWHVSRFHPDYQMTSTPSTPTETLISAYRIGKKAGLQFVYVGNMPGNRFENTTCPRCKTCLIERRGFQTVRVSLQNGTCPSCGYKIPGIFSSPASAG